MIDFYGRIFAVQEGDRPEIVLGPLPLPADKLAIRRGAWMPLVAPGEMRFDPARSAPLFDRICRIAVECGSELSAAAAALSAGRLDVASLLGDFLGDKEARLAEAAAAVDVAPLAPAPGYLPLLQRARPSRSLLPLQRGGARVPAGHLLCLPQIHQDRRHARARPTLLSAARADRQPAPRHPGRGAGFRTRPATLNPRPPSPPGVQAGCGAPEKQRVVAPQRRAPACRRPARSRPPHRCLRRSRDSEKNFNFAIKMIDELYVVGYYCSHTTSRSV
jgi:hypothetical protein